MSSISVLVPFVLVSSLAIGGVHEASRTTDCEVSPTVSDRPPDDPAASTFASPGGTWYANADRTLWAWWWGKRHNGEVTRCCGCVPEASKSGTRRASRRPYCQPPAHVSCDRLSRDVHTELASVSRGRVLACERHVRESRSRIRRRDSLNVEERSAPKAGALPGCATPRHPKPSILRHLSTGAAQATDPLTRKLPQTVSKLLSASRPVAKLPPRWRGGSTSGGPHASSAVSSASTS